MVAAAAAVVVVTTVIKTGATVVTSAAEVVSALIDAHARGLGIVTVAARTLVARARRVVIVSVAAAVLQTLSDREEMMDPLATLLDLPRMPHLIPLLLRAARTDHDHIIPSLTLSCVGFDTRTEQEAAAAARTNFCLIFSS